MTTPPNWPNPERTGEPMFPDRDGLHVFSMPDYPGFVAWEWIAKNREYRAASCEGEVTYSPEEMAREYRYHGPCLTPAQIDGIRAFERERCAVECDKLANEFLPCGTSDYAYTIRKLGPTL